MLGSSKLQKVLYPALLSLSLQKMPLEMTIRGNLCSVPPLRQIKILTNGIFFLHLLNGNLFFFYCSSAQQAR